MQVQNGGEKRRGVAKLPVKQDEGPCHQEKQHAPINLWNTVARNAEIHILLEPVHIGAQPKDANAIDVGRRKSCQDEEKAPH